MDEDKDDISELNINIARVLNVEVWAGAVRGPGGLSDSQTNGIKNYSIRLSVAGACGWTHVVRGWVE